MKNNPKLDFYRTDAVHTVLKRYEFSKNEKKIIQDAILTTKRNIPNMKAIEKADALLKMVSSSRVAIHKEEYIDDKGIAKAIAHTNMKKYKAPQSSFTIPRKSNATNRFVSGFVVSVVVMAIVSYAMKHQGKYTYQEAVEKCANKNQVLPLTMNDFFDSGYRFGQPAEFWTADGKLMITQVWISVQPEPEIVGYSYICVESNGKVSKTILR
jgi:hypothetical protein